jgi:hypothetical protein
MPVCHNAIHQRNCTCPSISPQQVVTASKKVSSPNPKLPDRTTAFLRACPRPLKLHHSWPLLRPQASKSSSLTPTPPISSDPSPSPSPSPPSSSSPISTSSSFLTFFALAFLTGVPSPSSPAARFLVVTPPSGSSQPSDSYKLRCLTRREEMWLRMEPCDVPVSNRFTLANPFALRGL